MVQPFQNYEFFDSTNPKNPVFITTDNMQVPFRPRVGDQIRLGLTNKLWRVQSADPADNPDNQIVKYFLVPYVPNQDSQFRIIVQDDPLGVP